MQSFIFGAGQDVKTPEELAKRREVQNALARAALGRAPRDLGEGLSTLGQAIAFRMMGNKNDAAEKAGRESANKVMDRLDVSSLFGGAPAYPSAVAAGASPTSGAATGTSVAIPQAAEIKQGMVDRGLAPHIADAFVANFQDESGLNPGINEKSPIVPGSRGGYGLYQLTGPRRREYEAYAADRGANPADWNTQLDFMMKEGQTTEKAAFSKILASKDTASAAQAIVNDFLRPSPEHRQSRSAKYAGLANSPPSQGVQVASLDPSIGLPPSSSDMQLMPDVRTGKPVDTSGMLQQIPNTPVGGNVDPKQLMRPLVNSPQGEQSPYPEQGKIAPYDFSNDRRFSEAAGMKFAGAPQPREMGDRLVEQPAGLTPDQFNSRFDGAPAIDPTATASIPPQQPAQQPDPKQAVRDALLKKHDTMFGGALAPQGQAPQQIADASGAFPPAPPAPGAMQGQNADARGAVIQKLMQAAQHPWLNDNQRAMVNALLQKQMDAGDPLKQLQMQKLQQEIAAGKQASDWSKLDDNRLYNQRTGEIRDLPTNPNAPAGDLGLNPQYGVDENGNPVLIQMSKNGKGVQTQLPNGVKLSKEPIKLDAGTHFVLLDPITRQPVGQIAKDVAGAASEGARGKAQAEAVANLPIVESNANIILSSIESLENDPYLNDMLGSFNSRLPNYTSNSARVQSKMDQIGGQTFLQAFNSLKGGGQITEVEGAKATAALARLSTAQSPDDYRQALGELKQIVASGVQRARQQAGGGEQGAGPTSGQSPAPQQNPASPPANNGGFRIIGVK